MTGLNIGSRIRGHRTALNMSQEELAGTCLCSRQTISNWETGKTLPDVQSLKYLAAAFDTTVDNLIADDEFEIIRKSSSDRRELQVLLTAEFALIACIAPIITYDRLHPENGVFFLVIPPVLCLIAIYMRERYLHVRHDLDTIFKVDAYIRGKSLAVGKRQLGPMTSFLVRHWLALAFATGVALYFLSTISLGH